MGCKTFPFDAHVSQPQIQTIVPIRLHIDQNDLLAAPQRTGELTTVPDPRPDQPELIGDQCRDVVGDKCVEMLLLPIHFPVGQCENNGPSRPGTQGLQDLMWSLKMLQRIR